MTNVRREQLGSYTLSWPEGVFPLGSDALFLGNFATLRPGWRVCDLGTGSGTLLLLLARREKELSLTGSIINPDTHQRAVNLLNSGRLKIEPLITHTFGLDRLEDAVLTQMGAESVKVMVHPQE